MRPPRKHLGAPNPPTPAPPRAHTLQRVRVSTRPAPPRRLRDPLPSPGWRTPRGKRGCCAAQQTLKFPEGINSAASWLVAGGPGRDERFPVSRVLRPLIPNTLRPGSTGGCRSHHGCAGDAPHERRCVGDALQHPKKQGCPRAERVPPRRVPGGGGLRARGRAGVRVSG